MPQVIRRAIEAQAPAGPSHAQAPAPPVSRASQHAPSFEALERETVAARIEGVSAVPARPFRAPMHACI